MEKLVVSKLGKTWILDLDGTIVKHNGYKDDGKDSFLEGAKEFLASIPSDDMIIFLTSRELKFKECTESFLKDNDIRYDHIIYEAPFGERIIINDRKPSGLNTAIAINTTRNEFVHLDIEIDENL